ncbi:hypothetical protein ElyMa_003418700 [Elysia marginata]|uniref:Uncharacterized protein n=1 Tax=Elysia marginata TaxID=1093978 RepID=A0AAV4JUF2_9GAST|nr:hypothetical protein ElyMa_003418700 [Elysia marginata]
MEEGGDRLGPSPRCDQQCDVTVALPRWLVLFRVPGLSLAPMINWHSDAAATGDRLNSSPSMTSPKSLTAEKKVKEQRIVSFFKFFFKPRFPTNSACLTTPTICCMIKVCPRAKRETAAIH